MLSQIPRNVVLEFKPLRVVLGLVLCFTGEVGTGKSAGLPITFDCQPPYVHRVLCGNGRLSIDGDGQLVFEGPRGSLVLPRSVPIRRIKRDAFSALGLDEDLELSDLVRSPDLFFLRNERADAIERVDDVTLRIVGIPDDTDAPFVVSSLEVKALVPNISAHSIVIRNPRSIRTAAHHYQITSLDDDWRENVVRIDNVDYGVYFHGFDARGRAVVTSLAEMSSLLVDGGRGTHEVLKIYAVPPGKMGIRLGERFVDERSTPPPSTEVILKLAMPANYKAWEPLVRTIRADLSARGIIRFAEPTFWRQVRRYLNRCELWVASFQDRSAFRSRR